MTVSTERFGEIKGNDHSIKEIYRFTLSNGSLILQVINYGATITSLKVPDKLENSLDIVLGFDNTLDYINQPFYFGCTVGRYANRIAGGQFSLENTRYSLAINNGPHHLHGGLRGFDKVIWSTATEENKIIFSYVSPSMDESYPGDLKCKVTYEITNENEIIINYKATTTHITPINLTNHSYFNLAGHGFGKIDDHIISLNADYYLPIDETGIPTGVIEPVNSTDFDLREPKSFVSLFDVVPDGFDHNFCINSAESEKKVARVYHPKSGISMEVTSTQPGVQLYTANFLPEDDSLYGKEKACYKKHSGFCLETQNYPNAINQGNFPKAYIDVGEVYNHTTKFSFSLK